MIKKYLSLLILSGLFATCVFSAVSTQHKKAKYTIKIAFLGSIDDEDYDGALVLKDFVESRYNGKVEVRIFPAGQFCGNERECIDAMQTGILEVFMTTAGGIGRLFGPAQVLDLPCAFSNDSVAECVFDGPMVSDLRNAALKSGLGMRLMTISNTGGWRNIATTSRQIREPADMAGLKIRTIASTIQQEMTRQLGANPTPIAWPEVYSALATGVVEGTKNSIQDIVGSKLHENIKFITLDGHAYMAAMWWYSEAGWQKLPTEMRHIVYDGFQRLKLVTRAMPIRRQIADYKEFKDQGGTIYVPTFEEKAKFRAATSGMRDWFVGSFGTEWLDKLDGAIAICEASTKASFDLAN